MTQFVCFCPKEEYKLDRFLAWLEAEHGRCGVHVLSLEDRLDLVRSRQKDFPRLSVEAVPFPSCGVTGYYSPEHMSAAFIHNVRALGASEGAVFASGEPLAIRYMPAYRALPIKRDFNYFRILRALGIKSVWTFDVNGARKHYIPYLLDDFVGRHTGRRAWVMGNGPSLKQLDMTLLKDEITFGSNRVYLGFEDWGWACTYWGICDSLQFEKHTREWELNIPDECVKFYPFEYLNLFHVENGVPVNFYPTGHPENKWNFSDPFRKKEMASPEGFSDAPGLVFLGHTVTYALLQVAVVMGCNPIYLIGCDNRYNITEEDRARGRWQDAKSSSHFHESYCAEEGRVREFHLPEKEKSERAFDYANTWAHEHGVVIENATPDTALHSFPKIDFMAALEKGVTGEVATVAPTPPKKKAEMDAPAAMPAITSSLRRSDEMTATILVCTPDIDSALAQKCLASIKAHTGNVRYELLVFENGRFGRFQHPLEINRALEIALGDVVVTLDDDVEVTEGWLEALLALAAPDVGIVGNVHVNTRELLEGTIRHAGAWLDIDGKAHHYQEPITSPTAVPFVCSACMLINDMSLRFDRAYKKFYQEADLCLRSWQKGKKVLVSPHRVYHYGHGQMELTGSSGEGIEASASQDHAILEQKWVSTGELKRLYDRIRDEIDIPLD